MIDTEEFRTIPRLEYYQVSNLGNVKRNNYLLSQRESPIGYRKVTVKKELKSVPFLVHRLVMLAFVGDCPKGKTVHHIDSNPRNNRLENLVYATHKEQNANLNRSKRKFENRSIIAIKEDMKIEFVSIRKGADYFSKQTDINIKSILRRIYSSIKSKKSYFDFIWSYKIDDKEWKTINHCGLEKYQVSSDGMVKRLDGSVTLGSLDKNSGYYTVTLSKKEYRVHILIAETFLVRPLDIITVVNHKDGCKTNNTVDNLEFVTHSQNTLHAHQNGLINITTKRKVISKDTNGNINEYDSLQQAAKNVNGHISNIIACCKGRQKTAYGFTWFYLDPIGNTKRLV
jgi:hypothetical protein